MQELTATGPVEFMPNYRFGSIKHSPRRSFWKAFAHNHPLHGTENAWPVVVLETREFLYQMWNGTHDNSRIDLYWIFDANIAEDLPKSYASENERCNPEDEYLQRCDLSIFRMCVEDHKVPYFLAQILADLYSVEIIIIMPFNEDVGEWPILIRGEGRCGQVILHLDVDGEWHAVRPLVRIPRNFRFELPEADFNRDENDAVPLDNDLPHEMLIRCAFVQYPFAEILTPLEGVYDEDIFRETFSRILGR